MSKDHIESADMNDGENVRVDAPMEIPKISKLDRRIAEPRMKKKRTKAESLTSLNNLDDGCLMHNLSFLSPIPGKFGSLTDTLSVQFVLLMGLILMVTGSIFPQLDLNYGSVTRKVYFLILFKSQLISVHV